MNNYDIYSLYNVDKKNSFNSILCAPVSTLDFFLYIYIYIYKEKSIYIYICMYIHKKLEHALSLSCNSTRYARNTIVNENPVNLEKTTSSVLSVLLLIYGSTI